MVNLKCSSSYHFFWNAIQILNRKKRLLTFCPWNHFSIMNYETKAHAKVYIQNTPQISFLPFLANISMHQKKSKSMFWISDLTKIYIIFFPNSMENHTLYLCYFSYLKKNSITPRFWIENFMCGFFFHPFHWWKKPNYNNFSRHHRTFISLCRK